MRPIRPRLTARARIIGWMILLVGIALGGSVLATAKIVSLRADSLTIEALNHEVDSFHAFVRSPTGYSQTSVEALLTRYLTDSVPDSGETYFTLLDGKPNRRSSDEPQARLDTDDAFVRHVARATEPMSGWWDTAAGRVRYGVIPVRVVGDPHHGALVIAEFRDVKAKPLNESVRIFGVVALVAVALAALASWLVAGKVLEPVRLMRQTAEKISESDLTRRIPVSGHDDVARLSITFNRMLDRLEDSFATQRQFLDDTTHELRTPITVVRGHLELMGDDPAELETTRALVLEELDRMRRIVDDLTDLARAERPDFLNLGEVELADLTVDLLTTVRVMADRQWAVDAVAEGTIIADGQRLTQAMVQLVSNAVKHTGVGDRIAVGSAYDGRQLTLWVDDSGAGVDPADAEHIFDRFRRGSGDRRVDGAGLGLSIVASIAEAHGGSARLADRPGIGARFEMVIPAGRADPGGEMDEGDPRGR